MNAPNPIWISLGRWGSLCAAGLFGATIGVIGGYHMASYYWSSTGPLQTDVATCRTIVDVYEAASLSGPGPALQRLSPYAYLCALQLDEGYRYLDQPLKNAVAEDLRQLSQLLSEKDGNASVEVHNATMVRLEKYAN